MKKTTYQIPEIRDDKDNIIQSGTYGKNSPLCNETNDGVLDYINNNLDYLKSTYDSIDNTYATKDELKSVSEESAAALNKKISDDSSAITTSRLTATTTTTVILTATGETSVPTANAGNKSKTIANTEYVQNSIASLVDSAPDTLNTLNELAKALGNDANFATTVTNSIGEKVSKSGDTITGPILYSKTPNDDAELPNKAYVDSAIKSAVNAAVASVTKTLSDNMHAQYPVGSYIYSDKADNPANYLPYMSDTTWEQTAAGRVLIGAGTADSGTVYNAGDKGGEEKHKLSADENGPHTHDCISGNGSHSSATRWAIVGTGVDTLNKGNVYNFTATQSSGDGKPHNNMQPYIAVHIFTRTA